MQNNKPRKWYRRFIGTDFKGTAIAVVVFLLINGIIFLVRVIGYIDTITSGIASLVLLLIYLVYMAIDVAVYITNPISFARSNLFSQESLDKLSKAERGDVQQIAASQIELLERFYSAALGQAQQSFRSALVAACAGFLFFLVAIGFLVVTQSPAIALVNVVSGTVVEVIAGLNFVLYGRATEQFGIFHMRLETTQRFLMANSICESIEGDLKHSTRADLVRMIAAIDPTPQKGDHGSLQSPSKHRASSRGKTDQSKDQNT